MDSTGRLQRAKSFFLRHFERIFVLVLAVAMLLIHYVVDQKLAMLSFYYLPMILAGFYGGKRFAVFAGLLVVALVFFFQVVEGLEMLPGLYGGALITLVPWAGFLILTGYVVGLLAEQAAERLQDVKHAYLATLELLTFHLESTEHQQQGHSHRVADLAMAIGRELKLPVEDVEDLRIAALLHEVGTQDQRLLRLLSRSVSDSAMPLARAMRGAAAVIGEYGHYYEIVGDEWDIEALPIPMSVRILAVADAFETLQMATPVRPALPKWSALEELEKGAGKTFSREAVRALRAVAGRPEAMALAVRAVPAPPAARHAGGDAGPEDERGTDPNHRQQGDRDRRGERGDGARDHRGGRPLHRVHVPEAATHEGFGIDVAGAGSEAGGDNPEQHRISFSLVSPTQLAGLAFPSQITRP